MEVSSELHAPAALTSGKYFVPTASQNGNGKKILLPFQDFFLFEITVLHITYM